MFKNSIETFREGTVRVIELPSAQHETGPRVEGSRDGLL
jgi:hypothetical protein